MSLLLIFLLIFIPICPNSTSVAAEKRSEDRFAASKGFLVYRTNSITQKSCTCGMTFSCSCCEYVVILFQKERKRLCVNFTYQRNGLNVDISLNSDIIQNMTITNYKPFRTCVPIPRCLFSIACANVMELNEFPRSITVCLRLDITAKKERWQISYNCVSISTELPTMTTISATSSVEMSSTETTPMMQTSQMPVMPPTQSMGGEMTMTTGMTPEMTEGTTVATSAMPMMPAMPAGMPGMAPGMPGMAPGMAGMPPAMSGMPPGMPGMPGMTPTMPSEMTT